MQKQRETSRVSKILLVSSLLLVACFFPIPNRAAAGLQSAAFNPKLSSGGIPPPEKSQANPGLYRDFHQNLTYSTGGAVYLNWTATYCGGMFYVVSRIRGNESFTINMGWIDSNLTQIQARVDRDDAGAFQILVEIVNDSSVVLTDEVYVTILVPHPSTATILVGASVVAVAAAASTFSVRHHYRKKRGSLVRDVDRDLGIETEDREAEESFLTSTRVEQVIITRRTSNEILVNKRLKPIRGTSTPETIAALVTSIPFGKFDSHSTILEVDGRSKLALKFDDATIGMSLYLVTSDKVVPQFLKRLERLTRELVSSSSGTTSPDAYYDFIFSSLHLERSFEYDLGPSNLADLEVRLEEWLENTPDDESTPSGPGLDQWESALRLGERGIDCLERYTRQIMAYSVKGEGELDLFGQV
ncbi:MAG: hypothetical protein ACTSU5_14705 [Promethearchaeota archaeon]